MKQTRLSTHYRLEFIEGTSSLVGTCYFEFCAESNRKKTCWNESAFYIEDEVFDFLHKPFLAAKKEFDYYGYCKFDQAELAGLKKRLLDFDAALSSLENAEGYEEFFGRVTYAGCGKKMR
jgi:hypothetical protein